jgi:hypothetical protein
MHDRPNDDPASGHLVGDPEIPDANAAEPGHIPAQRFSILRRVNGEAILEGEQYSLLVKPSDRPEIVLNLGTEEYLESIRHAGAGASRS